MEKHSILSMLDRQAEEDWLTPENLETKLNHQLNRILPPTILSHVDYYKKLNEYALLMEQGYTKEAEDLKLNKKIIDFKNKNMQPIYEELKMIVRHLTYSEEHSVFALYTETMMRIDNYFSIQNESTNEFAQLKENLTYLFKRLITLIRTENERPDNKLELIETQLKSLTMILVLWERYVEVIYMSDTEVEKMISYEKNISDNYNGRNDDIRNRTLEDLVEEKNPKSLKYYYLNKITEKKSKGSGLFINDFRGLYDDNAIRRTVDNKSEFEVNKRLEVEEEFTTESDEDEIVNKDKNVEEKMEGQISDKLSKDRKALPAAQEKAKSTKIKRKAITGEKRKLIESEVTEIFKEDEQWGEEEIENVVGESVKEKEISEKSKIKSKTSGERISQEFEDPLEPNLSTTTDKKENAFNKIKTQRKLLEEYMLMSVKREAEKSNYSTVDVQSEFKKYKANLVKDLGLKNEDELYADIDKELEEVDLSKIIDINDFEIEIKKEKERITLEKEFKGVKKEDLFNSSLFDSIIKYSKDIFDFKKPQISTNLDIYDENLIKYLEYSIEESNLMYKNASSSLIMEFIKEELNSIDDSQLSPVNKLKRKHLVRVADVCGRMRILDSQNLKQVFDMYKHPSVKFE